MNSYHEQIAAALVPLHVPAEETIVGGLARHLEMLDTANASLNLTRIPPDAAVTLHVVDSLLALDTLHQAPDGPFADLGSGAGFPGIPLALVSHRRVALVESVGKKCEFLRTVVAELRLDATVHPVRAEELALSHPQAFAAVTARALSALPSLVELASPLLCEGGLLIALKGKVEESEISRGRSAAALCGMSEIGVRAVVLPDSDATRCLAVYRRTGSAKVRLPRRAGTAQRKPLA